MGQGCCCCCEEESYRYSRPIPLIQYAERMNREDRLPLLHDDDDEYGIMECSYRNVCHRFVKSLEIPSEFFYDDGASKHNKCYCSRCHNMTAEEQKLFLGEWAGFALQVKSEDLQNFDDYQVAFHGTTSKDIEKILNLEEVTMPNSCSDTTSVPEHHDHYVISKQLAGHDDAQICVSPTLEYSGKYASPTLFYDATTETHYSCEVVFQVFIKLSSQTVSSDNITIDSEFNNSESEWSTEQVDTVMICGLLVKATEFNLN